jgi:hypothetical protein
MATSLQQIRDPAIGRADRDRSIRPDGIIDGWHGPTKPSSRYIRACAVRRRPSSDASRDPLLVGQCDGRILEEELELQ